MLPFPHHNAETLARDVRRWKLIAGVLLAGLVVLGAFSAFLVRQLDRDYSLLIDRTLPLIDEVRAVAREQSTTFRAIVSGLVENEPTEVAAALQQAEGAMARMRRGEAVLLTSDILQEQPDLLAALKQADAAYLAAANDLLPHVTTTSTAESERERLERLRAALERANAVSRQMIQFVENRSQAISDDYSHLARTHSAILFGIAGLPFIIVSLAVIAIVLVILTMILIFRRVGVGDGN